MEGNLFQCYFKIIGADYGFVMACAGPCGHLSCKTAFVEVWIIKAIVKVSTGSAVCSVIKVTMDDESRPPLRKAPKGTSLRMLMRTASSSRSSNPS